MASGIVPMMIYYGMKIITPKIFLFATCAICALISVMTGSSWTTIATVGVALIGIGTAHANWHIKQAQQWATQTRKELNWKDGECGGWYKPQEYERKAGKNQ